jgi:hypothetical protein
MIKTTWWWKRLDDENDLLMKTIYLSTLNWADKEFFLIFLYIANLEQTWQNSSNINSKIELRALISSIRSNINPRIGFELLSETRFYGQAKHDLVHIKLMSIIHLQSYRHEHSEHANWRHSHSCRLIIRYRRRRSNRLSKNYNRDTWAIDIY